MTNKMDRTSSNTSIDNDKSETVQPDSKENALKEDAIEYPPPAQAALVMLALLLALFLGLGILFVLQLCPNIVEDESLPSFYM